METPDVINLLQENPFKFHCNVSIAFIGASGTVWYSLDDSLRIHLRTRMVKMVCLHNLHVDKL